MFVSPMCQYSSKDGMPNDWHLVHLGSRAVGGAGLVMTEATAVSPEGRISPADLGIWSDEQAEFLRRITDFVKMQGSVAGIQLAHAGRKASTRVPWVGDGELSPEEKPWQTLAPSAVPFSNNYPKPKEMTKADIDSVIHQFRDAAMRSLKAGFQVIEIHMAHGYLLHEFLSPISNRRSDQYGGDLRNRLRLPMEVVMAVREVWTEELPLFVRISVTDWIEGGWDLKQSVELSKELLKLGVDLIDCSSGGIAPGVKIPVAYGYQVHFSDFIRKNAGILTGAVGMITNAIQAENILVTEQADVVFLAREFLRDPYFPLHAAEILGDDPEYPVQYLRAKAT
ncbi:MAG: NADH:flavin oxidoreductase/NADH oxidase [Candidatus Kryptoniota bacterium]